MAGALRRGRGDHRGDILRCDGVVVVFICTSAGASGGALRQLSVRRGERTVAVHTARAARLAVTWEGGRAVIYAVRYNGAIHLRFLQRAGVVTLRVVVREHFWSRFLQR